MTAPLRIDLINVVLSLSDALDAALPRLGNHPHRVAYIALRIADEVGFPPQHRNDLLYASALRGVALVGGEEMLSRSGLAEEMMGGQAAISARMLEGFPLFHRAAEYVRYHMISWSEGAGAESGGKPVPLASQILHLAQWVETIIDPDVPVLQQRSQIIDAVSDGRERWFQPEVADAFVELASTESFWLDIVNRRVYSLILGLDPAPVYLETPEDLLQVGRVFAQLIDFKSRFTATHSSGVAASAAEIARRLGMAEHDQRMLEVAGLLHDLGKLAVPLSILDKPGKLEDWEFEVVRAHPYHTYHILRTVRGLGDVVAWACQHHERVDGGGYPFHVPRDGLSLGARIMSVADVLTALAEDRPYRKGMPKDRIKCVLEEMATDSLDPEVVDPVVADLDDIRHVALAAQRDAEQRYRIFSRDLEESTSSDLTSRQTPMSL